MFAFSNWKSTLSNAALLARRSNLKASFLELVLNSPRCCFCMEGVTFLAALCSTGSPRNLTTFFFFPECPGKPFLWESLIEFPRKKSNMNSTNLPLRPISSNFNPALPPPKPRGIRIGCWLDSSDLNLRGPLLNQ